MGITIGFNSRTSLLPKISPPIPHRFSPKASRNNPPFIKSLRFSVQVAPFGLFFLHISQFDIIPRGFKHLYERLIYNFFAFLNQPIRIGRRGTDIFGEFCLCSFRFYAFDLYIGFHGIFGKKCFPLHAVCDILTPKSIVYWFKKAQSFQPVD